MTVEEADYLERLAIALEGGDVAESRAREVAALPREGAVPALPAQERRDVAAGAAKVTRRRV